jgi:antitoxin ParD1/3/4/toxin ParE1/3/4
MGHLREDLTDEPVRFWSLFSYVIVYDPETQPLQILRILHSARDLRRILDEER